MDYEAKVTGETEGTREPGLWKERSLELLYERSADRAVRFAYLLTGSHESAEDLVQEAFVRCSAKLIHLRHPEAFESYLHKTIVNLGRNEARRSDREARAKERLYGQAHISADDTYVPSDEVNEILLSLPYRQRAALVLRFYLDLDYASCARFLAVGETSVRSLVSRGLTMVRTELEDRHGH